MTGLRWGARTDVGRARTVNQDNVLAAAPLFAVADGMGGHAAGDVASRVALDALVAAVPPPAGGGTGRPSLEAFVGAVREANRSVFERSLAEEDLRGMGTTLCAVALVTIGGEERLVVVNVGDSRGYVVQDGRLLQITRDHSYVEDLVQAGEITRAQAKDHPRRNIVTRALGIEPDVEIDSWEVVPYPGDRYLLCSDGLFNEVDDAAITAVLTGQADAQLAADRLVEMANDGGGHDNISVVVVDVTADDTFAPAPGAGGAAPDATRTLPAVAAAGPVDEAAAPGAAAAAPARATPPDRRPRRRLTFRAVALIAAVVLVVAVALGAIGYYGRKDYFVGFAGENVALYQGRPGGLLWLDPTVETTYPLTRASVPPEDQARLDAGYTFDQQSSAEAYIANLVAAATTTTTTTTTLPPTTTTTAVPVPTTLPPEAAVVTTAPPPPAPVDTAPPAVP